MDDYSKEKWSADFPDRAGQEVRPTEAVENTLDYDVLFPQYLSEDPVVFNQQNKTVSQLVSNDARLYERISATAADINAHLTDAKPMPAASAAMRPVRRSCRRGGRFTGLSLMARRISPCQISAVAAKRRQARAAWSRHLQPGS